MVRTLKDSAELKQVLTEAGDKLVVIDFYATWCGPCKMIAPKYEQFSEEYKNVVFLKVDVDESEDITTEYEVTSMPTFVFIKAGKVLDTMVGASPDKLQDRIVALQ